MKLDVPVLVALRGDWFCMPFGGNADAFRGEQHPPHGEVAGGKWRLVESKIDSKFATLKVELETKVRPGRVTREWSLVEGHNVVYGTDTIEGFAGPAPLGSSRHAGHARQGGRGAHRHQPDQVRHDQSRPSSAIPRRANTNPSPSARDSLISRKVPLQFKGAPDADVDPVARATGIRRPAANLLPAWGDRLAHGDARRKMAGCGFRSRIPP